IQLLRKAADCLSETQSLCSDRSARGLPHDRSIRIVPGPKFELLDRLRNQHLQTRKRFASGVAGLAQKLRLDGIVDEIVSQPHPAELFIRGGRLLHILTTPAPPRGAYTQLELISPR